MNFCFYDDEGKIDYVLSAHSEDFARAQGGSFIPCSEDFSDDTHYVDLSGDDPVLLGREESGITVEKNGLSATIFDIPEGSLVRVGESSVVSGGETTEIEFDAPGTYEIRIYPPPQYLDEVLEVTVG